MNDENFLLLQITWVDLFATCYLSQLTGMPKDTMNAVPKLKGLIDTVLALPQIKKWVGERPVTAL